MLAANPDALAADGSLPVWIRGSTATSRGGISRRWPKSVVMPRKHGGTGVPC